MVITLSFLIAAVISLLIFVSDLKQSKVDKWVLFIMMMMLMTILMLTSINQSSWVSEYERHIIETEKPELLVEMPYEEQNDSLRKAQNAYLFKIRWDQDEGKEDK